MAHIHMHMQAHTDNHTNGGACARVVAGPASGASLMHVDCTLEPLGMEPSGSVCPVHQPAFTEVPGTTPVPPPGTGSQSGRTSSPACYRSTDSRRTHQYLGFGESGLGCMFKTQHMVDYGDYGEVKHLQTESTKASPEEEHQLAQEQQSADL